MPHQDTETLANTLPADGELAYADRRAIHAELDPSALLALELMCAERVHPVWAAKLPDDDEPRALVEAAGAAPGDAALRGRVRDLHTHLDNLALRGHDHGPAVSAGLAYWAIARNLVFGRPEEPADIDGEMDLDPDDWSPCFYAATAETEPPWEEESDPEKRREFWRWYLLEALPAVRRSQ